MMTISLFCESDNLMCVIFSLVLVEYVLKRDICQPEIFFYSIIHHLDIVQREMEIDNSPPRHCSKRDGN